MRRARANWLVVASLVGLVALGVLFVAAREGASTVAARFMDALARQDAATLTQLSYMDGVSAQELRSQWDYAVNVAGKYYRFNWEIRGETQTGPDSAAVRMGFWRNYGSPGSYDENFQLNLIRIRGTWKVDVRSISREMYPGLPR